MNSRMPIIQIYRALAAIFVILLHLEGNMAVQEGVIIFNNSFQFGYSGVDFFFVLSGFIITYIHFKDIEAKKNVWSYCLKRAIRIYPIYWLICILFLITYYFTNKDLIQSLNFSYVFKSFLLIKQKEDPFVRVAWSLCFEILFYVIFGVCIMLGRKFAKILFFLWLFIILSFNFLLKINFSSDFIGFLVNMYIVQFLLGCLTGYLIKMELFKYKKIAWPIGLFTLALTYSFLYFVTINRPDAITKLLFGISFALIIYGTFDFKAKFKLANKLIEIGNASYLIYLIHLIPLAFFIKLYSSLILPRISLNKNIAIISSVYGFFCLIVIVWVSLLMHKYVEQPLVERLRRIFLKPKRVAQKQLV